MTRTSCPPSVAADDLDVLIGIDGSPSSLAAATRVVELIGSRIGTVTLAAVLDRGVATLGAAGATPGCLHDPDVAQSSLAAASQELATRFGVPSSSVVLEGDPAAVLVAYAHDRGCKLLVTGRRGRGSSKSVLGSCAARLANHARIPVLLVREPTAAVA
jgi:nucleotide-binding universal stress UspA family protein